MLRTVKAIAIRLEAMTSSKNIYIYYIIYQHPPTGHHLRLKSAKASRIPEWETCFPCWYISSKGSQGRSVGSEAGFSLFASLPTSIPAGGKASSRGDLVRSRSFGTARRQRCCGGCGLPLFTVKNHVVHVVLHGFLEGPAGFEG